jgi:hypothetical protein
LRHRFPPREDLRLVFGGCAFVIHVWAILNLLDALPAWVLRLTAYELAGVIAYPLFFALLESLFVWGVLILAAVLLPQRWLRQRFVSRGMALLLVTAAWSIAIHFKYESLIQNLGYLPVWLGAYLASTVAIVFLAGHYQKVENILRAILQRIEVLSFLYIFIDILGLFVIISRSL